MRPPAPAVYRPLLVERLGIPQVISPAGRMIVRELERRPLRTVLSVVAVATGLATLVVGQFSGDAFDYLLDMQFSRVTRDDLTVTLRNPVPQRALDGLAHIPGVWRAEGIRAVPVRLEAGPRYREVPVVGLPDGAELRRVVGRATGQPVPLPPDGLLLTKTLAEVLGLAAGDSVAVRLLEGERRTYRVPVAGLVDELIGLQGYMRLPALSRLVGEAPTISAALLGVDRGRERNVIGRLNDMPGVLSVTSHAATVTQLRKQSGQSMAVITLVLTIFAATITVGVVYNNARVALSMRSRDFASLRVLGFTRAEISRTLLSELAAEVLLAIPVGLLLGTWLTSWVLSQAHPERYRFPLVVSPRTYAFAVLVVLASSAVSGLLVRRQLDHLDLIGVLKTRE
jgi:putative ABC transport system permease protein